MRFRFGVKARSRVATVLFAVGMIVAFWASAAQVAHGAPQHPMNLEQLQARLDANGGEVEGYFRTVLSGDTITQIPVTIQSIVPLTSGDGVTSMYVLFAANDARIAQIGGIAYGMSGSPLFVRGDEFDWLVGAVSGGYEFTLGDLGLATPIEDMTAIEDLYLSAAPTAIRKGVPITPVEHDGRSIQRVVLATSVEHARQMAADASTVVFAPLRGIQIGGLAPQTGAYKALARRFENKGLPVMPSGVAASGSASSTSPLLGGASLGAMYSLGDLWAGAMGTVTYVDGSRLLGFGHPLEWLGPTEAYLTNAWVVGMWGSSQAPFKLMYPTALRGTISQDRGSGIAGEIDVLPEDTTVTSSATFNGRTLNSTSVITRRLASTFFYSPLAAAAAAVPVYKVLDQWSFPGSARTTSVIVVNDGVQDHTVTRTNLWDSYEDVSYQSTGDLWNMLVTLTENPDGIAPVTVKSVRFEGSYSGERSSARIISAGVPGGLRIGANEVEVALAAYGIPALQIARVTMTLPPGTPRTGLLEVYGGTSPDAMGDAAAVAPDDRRTVVDIVNDLNGLPANNDLVVVFRPDSRSGDYADPIEAVASTDWVVSGALALPTSTLSVTARPKTVRYGGSTTLAGRIGPVAGDTRVSVYATPKGSSARTLIATVPATESDGLAVFQRRLTNLKKTTRFTVVWAGDQAALGSSSSVLVTVRPRVVISTDRSVVKAGSSVRVTAGLLPAQGGRRVVFERRRGSGPWTVFARTTTGATGTSSVKWAPALRADYSLRATIAGARSATATVRVR